MELGHTLATPLRKFDKLESGNTHTVCATGGSMHQKKIEQQALKVGIVVNIVMVLAGFFVFFLTGLKSMFLDASFTVISVISASPSASRSSRITAHATARSATRASCSRRRRTARGSTA